MRTVDPKALMPALALISCLVLEGGRNDGQLPRRGAKKPMSIRFPILALIFFSGVAFAQSDYDSRTLEVKRMFSERVMQALNEPFVGVTSDGSVEPGLFSIRASGPDPARNQ